MASNELLPPQKNEITQKTEELASSIVDRANTDRDTAKQIYDFIMSQINKMESDYQTAKDAYDTAFRAIASEENEQIKAVMLCKLGKPPRKHSIVSYIEQLNRSLEMSIKSTADVSELLQTIIKSQTKKVDVEEVNIDNRTVLLDEIIKEEEAKKKSLEKP